MGGRVIFWSIAVGGFLFFIVNKRETIMTEIKKVGDSALRLIAGFEGFEEYPYKDAQGQSVGYGHFILPTDRFVYPMSKSTANFLLRADAQLATSTIDRVVTVPLTSNQRDALTSLAFNIGSSAFSKSTLVKKLNNLDYAGAANEFTRWNKSRNSAGILEVFRPLVSRRAFERAHFLT